MLRTEGVVVVAATPREVLEFVLDLERYRLADLKIGDVKQVVPPDALGRGRVRYRGGLRGLPTPVDTQDLHLERWSGLRIRGTAGVWTRWATDFEGEFRCEPVDGGTAVTHTETFWFRPAPLRWLAEAYLRTWMDQEMPREMALLRQHVEAAAAGNRRP